MGNGSKSGKYELDTNKLKLTKTTDQLDFFGFAIELPIALSEHRECRIFHALKNIQENSC